MNEELRKAIADYFDPGEFAEFIGVKTDDLITAFPDEVDEALDDIKEMMGLQGMGLEDNYDEETD